MLKKLTKNKKIIAIIAAVAVLAIIGGLIGGDSSEGDDIDPAVGESVTEQIGQNSEKEDENTEPAKDEILVPESDSDAAAGQKQGKDSVKFQSMFDYFSPDFTFDEIEQKGLMYRQDFHAAEEDEDLVAEYMNFLCSDSMNFVMADDYYEDYREGPRANNTTVFASWGLSYTGTASVEENCTATFLPESQKYAISAYYTIEFGKIKGTLYWSASLDSCDLGFRAGGQTESTLPGGESVTAGLIRTADGKYETTDGRFSAGLNEVVFTENGTMQNGVLEYANYSPDASDMLKIQRADNNRLLCAFFPYSGDQKTGAVYGYTDLVRKYQFGLSGDPYGAWAYETPVVYQYVGSEWLTATYSDSPCKDMTLRIMYYDKTEQVAVYYIYTKFLSETEAFCVVDLSKAAKPDGGNSSGSAGGEEFSLDIYGEKEDKPCIWCDGEGEIKCTSCDGKGYYMDRGSVANYAGSDYPHNYNIPKDCVNLKCNDGYEDCPYCW